MIKLNRLLPWYFKIIAKILLSRLPVSYKFWRKCKIFLHGKMDKPEYALSVFERHFQRSHFLNKSDNFACLELGPGDSLLSAMVGFACGSRKYFLVDTDSFATQDVEPYNNMAGVLCSRGMPTPQINSVSNLADILDACNAVYLTEGLKSLQKIQTGSIDFIWSQAVLEHIRRHEFLETMQELRRLLKPGGICSHRIDLKDHLGGKLNNLLFGSRLWESSWFSQSGFYTNRLRYPEMLNLFRQAGFDVEVVAVNRWDAVPTPRHKMAIEFQSLSEEDLMVKEFDVLLRPCKRMEALH